MKLTKLKELGKFTVSNFTERCLYIFKHFQVERWEEAALINGVKLELYPLKLFLRNFGEKTEKCQNVFWVVYLQIGDCKLTLRIFACRNKTIWKKNNKWLNFREFWAFKDWTKSPSLIKDNYNIISIQTQHLIE